MKAKQLEMFQRSAKAHGGSIRLGKRKIARPIATKSPMHLVLRSLRARGMWSLLASAQRKRDVAEIVLDTAEKFGVRLYKFENVGNHLHLLVQARRRRDVQNFLRVLPQKIMFLVTKAKKGAPKGKFWDGLAFSRVVNWGKDFLNARRYLAANKLESLGIPRSVLQQESFYFRFAEPAALRRHSGR